MDEGTITLTLDEYNELVEAQEADEVIEVDDSTLEIDKFIEAIVFLKYSFVLTPFGTGLISLIILQTTNGEKEVAPCDIVYKKIEFVQYANDLYVVESYDKTIISNPKMMMRRQFNKPEIFAKVYKATVAYEDRSTVTYDFTK